MNHRKLVLSIPLTVIMLTAFCGITVFAQSTAGLPADNPADISGQEFLPFVTNLEGEIKNNLLRLTWTDSPHAKGPVYIYRSAVPFDENSVPIPGRPETVPYGTGSYIDELDDSGIYYYLAIASDGEGRGYYPYINAENTVCIQMTGSIGLTGIQGAAVQPAEQPPAAVITNIKALADNEKVIISFNSDAGINPVLYRGTRPIRNTTDLLGSVIIQSNVTSPFYDFPVHGIPYYYAVIPANELNRGNVTIQPGINATEDPAGINAEKSSAEARSVPLPLIAPGSAVSENFSGETTNRPQDLSPAVNQALADIPPYRKDPMPEMFSQVFPQDLKTAGGGEDYLLASIVQNRFLYREWEITADELTRFIALPRSKNTEARARYYLGQCLFFTGSYRDALFEFLSVRSVYPEAAAEWIQAVLRMMTE